MLLAVAVMVVLRSFMRAAAILLLLLLLLVVIMCMFVFMVVVFMVVVVAGSTAAVPICLMVVVMVLMCLMVAAIIVTGLQVLHFCCCLGCCHGAPMVAFNVQIGHHLVHSASKDTFQRHLRHISRWAGGGHAGPARGPCAQQLHSHSSLSFHAAEPNLVNINDTTTNDCH
jgi:energy-coupling factor transporter transmembrane protein EcfT